MVVKTDDNSEIAVNFRGGGSLIDLPPLFSSDGDSVFVAWKNSVLEYSTKTGKLIHEYKGLTDRIIGFSYHIFDSHYCLTACGETGKVIGWKTLTHSKILEKKLPLDRIKTFTILSHDNDELKALVSYIRKNSCKFTIADLKKRSTKDFSLYIPFTKDYKLAVSKHYFAVIYDNNICFVRFNEHKKVAKQSISETRLFTCLDCHPTEEMVLVGDNIGRVILWQNIFTNAKPTQSVYHWHTLPVQTVCFSPSGSYFYSGGNECVLVKWQLEDVYDRKFVPRISAEIKQIAVASNNIFIAVSTEDNALRIFDNTLNQVSLIQHLVLGKHYECGMHFDARTRALIMNGNQGHIQFYAPEDMSLLYSIDIIKQNKITNERDCVMINTEITKIALSKSGLWLATVEERRDNQYHNEIRLKFWHFMEEKQIFELNTSVEYPHEMSVNSIRFQPLNRDENLKCITVGDDKKFKVWKLIDIDSVYKKGKVWSCHSIGFHRDMSCMALSFSVDGSLMATGFGPILTVWVPETCELKCSLLHPIHRETVRFVEFGNSDQCHLLVCASKTQLCIWNLLTLCMVWTVPLNVSLLIADTLSANMAVFTEDKKVFVFNPNSHLPIYTSGALLPRKKDKIITATFFPSKNHNDSRRKWFERSHLYFISSNNELFRLGNETSESESSENSDYLSTFSKMMPREKVNMANPVESHKHMFEKDVGQQAIKEFLLGPTHMLPPMRFMCHSLLRSLVIQKESDSVD